MRACHLFCAFLLALLAIPAIAATPPAAAHAMPSNAFVRPPLELWLRRAGFTDVKCVDVSTTTVEEQRGTEWMKYQSLSDFLDPEDHSKTIEGLPAPMRAVIVARK